MTRPTPPLPEADRRGFGEVLLDDGTDRFNRVCTHIAIIMLGGIFAIAFVAEIIR
jgi:hypothetical protein